MTVQKLYMLGLKKYFPYIQIESEEDNKICEKMELNEPEKILTKVEELSSIIFHKELTEKQKLTWNTKLDQKKLKIWIDPLDGTKEFTLGNLNFVTSLLGITEDDIPSYGIIAKPFLDEDLEKTAVYFGGRGIGLSFYSVSDNSFKEIEKVDESKITKMRVAVTHIHPSAATEDTLKVINPAEILRIGGSGNKILSVIKGTADYYVYPSRGLCKWDTCAGEAIMREMNYYITDSHGFPISYKERAEVKGIICGRQAEIGKKIAEDIKPILKKHLLI